MQGQATLCAVRAVVATVQPLLWKQLRLRHLKLQGREIPVRRLRQRESDGKRAALACECSCTVCFDHSRKKPPAFEPAAREDWAEILEPAALEPVASQAPAENVKATHSTAASEDPETNV